jgi:hypothetical protein
MMTAEDYRGKAEECEAMVARCGDDGIRAMYLQLASQWRFIAEQAEYLQAKRVKPR